MSTQEDVLWGSTSAHEQAQEGDYKCEGNSPPQTAPPVPLTVYPDKQ